MKRKYNAPTTEIVEIKSEVILDGSISIDKDGEGGAEQLSNRHSGGKWGDLWKQ